MNILLPFCSKSLVSYLSYSPTKHTKVGLGKYVRVVRRSWQTLGVFDSQEPWKMAGLLFAVGGAGAWMMPDHCEGFSL